MERLMRLFIITGVIGTGLAVIMAVTANQLGYDSDPMVMGWVFGVLAMGMVVMSDTVPSHPAAEGGK